MTKKKKKCINEKGVFSFALAFLFIIAFLLFLLVFIVPIAIQWNTALYSNAESIFEQAEADANRVVSPNVKASMLESIESSKSGITEQTDLLSSFFQFAWILIIIMVSLVVFVAVRSRVEVLGSGLRGGIA